MACTLSVQASDWEEEKPEPEKNRKHGSDDTGDLHKSSASGVKEGKAPLQGKVVKGSSLLPSQSNKSSKGDSSGLQALSDSANSAHKDLEGKAIDSELRGAANELGLKDLSALTDRLQEPLKGSASLDQSRKGREIDPDADDSELLVEWDRWRNRFLRAVQLGTQENINNPDPEDYEAPRVDPYTGQISSRYPLGTGSAFSCVVTSDGQIKNLEIIEASGFPKYDKAVLRAVRQLAGTQILRFPKGSHRQNIVQPGRIKTATSNQFKFHHFGDVERVQH